MSEPKYEAVEHFVNMMERYRDLKETDFIEVTKASFRLISVLEEIIHYSKKISSFESFEPNYEELSHELSLVINKFKEGNMKKRVILDIRAKGKEMLNTRIVTLIRAYPCYG